MVKTEPKTKRRTASKEERKKQLIEATLDCIARSGFAETTLSAVSKQAGLSQGIVNLHFQSKEMLLLETLQFLTDDYTSAWETAMEQAGDTAAEKLEALIRVDFTKQVCDRRKLAVWFAFWGEAKSRPTYQKICKARDEAYGHMLEELCVELAKDYEGVNPVWAATGIDSMVEGLWLDILIGIGGLNRQTACDIAIDCLARYFPKHFQTQDAT